MYGTILATAVLFLTIGVLVGVWLRGLIQSDSTAYAGATPTEPCQQPPTSTPVIPFPAPALVSTTVQTEGYLADLLDISGKRLAVVRMNKRARRFFLGGAAWDHVRTDAYGRWQYQPVEALTLAQKRQLMNLPVDS